MFDWNNYHKFAEKLKDKVITDNGDSDQTARRVAISRAYYAAYNIACKYSKSVGLIFDKNKGGKHDQVRNYIVAEAQKSGDRSLSKVAVNLASMKRKRVNADYELYPVFTHEDANAQIEEAREVIETINQKKSPV